MADLAQQVPNEPSSADAIPPDQSKSTKGRFQKGNTAAKGRGRPKGSETVFGAAFHERLVRGITKAGIKKAQKAGINGPIDGLEFYITELAASNLGAAASLLTKLISLESPQAESANQIATINILPVASGQHYLPGSKILAPSEVADQVWEAFRGGPATWQAYLVANTLTWSAEAHAHLSQQEAPLPRGHLDNVVPLQLEPPVESELEPEFERHSIVAKETSHTRMMREALKTRLASMSDEMLMALAGAKDVEAG